MRKSLAVVGVAAVLMFSCGIAGAQSAAEAKYNELMGYMQQEWATMDPNAPSGPDHNWDGVPDPYQVALLAAMMVDDPAVQAIFDANLVIANDLIADDPLGWGYTAALAPQIAVYACIDEASFGALMWYYWYAYATLPEGTTFTDNYPFTRVALVEAGADADNDGMSNAAEYAGVSGLSGSPVDFGASASNPVLHGNLPSALPVAGVVGLGLLAGAAAVAGALKLRKKS